MSFLDSLKIAGSALTAHRFRIDTVAQNLANINTTRTEDGTPYARKLVVLQERNASFANVLNKARKHRAGGGVEVQAVIESKDPFIPVYDPSHPDANADGYVMMPNVNTTEEQIALMAASRAYEANLTALNVVKTMAMKALEIGK